MDEKEVARLAQLMLSAIGGASFLNTIGAAVVVLTHIARQAPAEHAAHVSETLQSAIRDSLQ